MIWTRPNGFYPQQGADFLHELGGKVIPLVSEYLFRDPYPGKESDWSLCYLLSLSVDLNGIALGYLVAVSHSTSKYLFPDLLLGRGMTMFMAILLKGMSMMGRGIKGTGHTLLVVTLWHWGHALQNLLISLVI